MPIKAGDVKLVASAVMDDVPEGGGAPSTHVIQDNVSNEIFKDISESDRARGRFNAAKVHVSVQTDDTDTYLGANVIVGRPPDDPNVSITLFTTNDVYDTRIEAVSRLEAYLNKSSEWSGFLYENHISGQRTIQLFQRVGSEIPPVGRTLCLVQGENTPAQQEQYVRVTRASAVERTFTYDTDKDYRALIVTLELSDALRHDFRGTAANRQFTRVANSAITRDTTVADAASYAGVVPLASPIKLGDFSLKATGIHTPLVPSAQVETPLVAQQPTNAAGFPVRANQTVSYTSTQIWTTTTNFVLPGGCTPGTLQIATAGTTIVDKGGRLFVGDAQVGIIDYANGILSLSTGSFSASKSVVYEPAAYVTRMPQTVDIAVTQETRSLNYASFTLTPPAPGTTSISYMVQGSWYVLSDDGSGALRGFDASHGAGSINTEDGSFVVTLGALPDVGSAIVIQWGVSTQEYTHAPAVVRASQTRKLEVADDETMNPGLLRIQWMDGEQTKVATASAAGVISGDGTGNVDLNLGQFTFAPNTLPVVGTEMTATYDVGPKLQVDFAHPSRNGAGRVPVNPGVTNLVHGSVVVEWNTLTDLAVLKLYSLRQLQAMGIGLNIPVDPIQSARDDGAGNLVLNGATIGTVNYETGDIVFVPDVAIQIPTVNYSPQPAVTHASGLVVTWRINYQGIGYISAPSLYPNDETGWVRVKCYTAGADTRKTDVFAFRPSFPLLTGTKAPAVPGSLVLTDGTLILGDNGVGTLREIQTDGGVLQRGTIDYTNGLVTLTSWPVGISSAFTRANLTTTLGENISSAFVFRTAAAPLRPGSLTIQFARAGGGTQVVTADVSGVISATGVTGTVDYQTGLVRLGFGETVTAAGNEDEPWFNPAFVVEGRIFRPNPVASSTVRYTAVAFNYMPLNADIVGVDPVRLPSDGRVAIFRSGTMVVVGNTKKVRGITPSNGQKISLGRTRLSRATVRDATNKTIYTGYTVDLDAGTVTFDNVAGMAAPVDIEHRIEDMLVAREVEISGAMTFTRQISHDYPVEDTYVSSALEFGDRRARVSVTFDQATWNGVEWADAPVGAVATASYNTVLSPIEVENYGASTERFALWFTSSTQYRVIGQHVGQIATGDINTVCAPINPATGHPYFTIRPIGWGTGWANGNVLRLNTVGALAPVWVVRTVQPGAESGVDYSFDLLTRGDVDRP